MLRLNEIRLPIGHPADALHAAACRRLALASEALRECHIARRGVDARKRNAIEFVYSLDVALASEADEAALLVAHQRKYPGDSKLARTPDQGYRPVAHAPAAYADRPVVIGFGPAGIFAALILAQAGYRPLVLERGKAVRERTKDTWELWRKHILHPESNVQFGEGGAGTFSDGKLYSQIKDPRHLARKVLTEFVKAGAPEEILYVSKPHIGTFRLVSIVEKIRAEIIALGGEIRFESRVADLLLDEDVRSGVGGMGGDQKVGAQSIKRVRGVVLSTGEHIESRHVVLALGHSARDSFEMLHARGVFMEAKAFSVGFRIEHPQDVIDRARFGAAAGHPLLGAADYKLVHHASNGRAVYSFCMCPGGQVVAATSETGRVVTNGMSQYSRAERNANAGLVVDIAPEDYAASLPERNADGSCHPLAGIAFQRDLESRAYTLGGSNYNAPVQRVGDFLADRASTALGEVVPSYQPGVKLTDLSSALPDYAIASMREALPAFDKKIRGFAMGDAVLTGVETRTSSPLRITRGDDFQSLNVCGLFPAAEGAGYAGGILSAAVDGIKVAEAVAAAISAA